LLPDQFWSLTPAQFNALAEGFYRRQRRRLEETAHWVCTLVNHFPMRGRGAKTLRVEQLIGMSFETQKLLEKKRKTAAAKKSEGS
jgi:hypothetical protein